jgi:hypothetical protein
MMRILSTLAVFLSTITTLAHAHGQIIKYTVVGGESIPGWDYWKKTVTAAWHCENGDNGFVDAKDINSPDIICHKNATPAPKYLHVQAGQTINMKWNQWPDSHKGPIISYIASCEGECTSVDKTKLEWVKFQQAGLAGKEWVTDRFLKAGKTSNATIPAALKAGNYVLRHEMIALHAAQNGNAQFYPQCVNLKVSGTGQAVPKGGVRGTKLYRPKEPGVVYDLYKKEVSRYPIPGPPVWKPA